MKTLITNKKYHQYKEYPDGSGGKQRYDATTMDIVHYLEKYYAEPNLFQWNQFNSTFVDPAFRMTSLDYGAYVKELKIPYGFNFDHGSLQENYKRVLRENIEEEELSRFFAYFISCDYLKKKQINFEQWLQMKDWINPGVSDYNLSIIELLQINRGENFLKVHLMNIPIFKMF
ncbi:hypothetical protein [Aquimarina brevivitae]|uniref:Uncharacterized protein n=1 Tax=Aquimarina brevivitae TaxID=323412 RepID=A0A4Q7P165_9FLAO|nr:hypothetical protein [Aquimarina brevivitae]RZS93566.1 hypothetical protein EV197_2146 [Aquimarina brevivitae]